MLCLVPDSPLLGREMRLGGFLPLLQCSPMSCPPLKCRERHIQGVVQWERLPIFLPAGLESEEQELTFAFLFSFVLSLLAELQAVELASLWFKKKKIFRELWQGIKRVHSNSK